MNKHDNTNAANLSYRLQCMINTKSPKHTKPPTKQTVDNFTNFLSLLNIPLNLTKLAISQRTIILFFKKNKKEMAIKGDNFAEIRCEGESFTGHYNGVEFTYENVISLAKFIEKEYRNYISKELEERRSRLLNGLNSHEKEITNEPIQV